MNLSDFFYDNFVQGWSSPESYNLFDTLAYALLAVIVVYVSYSFLKKRVKFSYMTGLQVIPFIILASIVRVFADSGVYPRFFWTVTPGVWLIFFTIAVTCLVLDSKYKTKGKFVIFTPIVLIIPHLFFLGEIVHSEAVVYFTFFYALSLLPFYLLRNKFKLLSDNFNLLAIAAHMFDATSSFVNVDFFNYVEIHLLGGFFSNLFGGTGFIMYLLKLIVLLPVLHYIDTEKDNNLKNYLKLIICVLGFGPGIRNLITVILGV